MNKHFSIFTLLFFAFGAVSGQIWKYPNLPYGFKDSENRSEMELKKGIESETIIEIYNNDTTSIKYCEYDSLGRLKMTAIEKDTLTYFYHINGLWKTKKSLHGEFHRKFTYNNKGRLVQLLHIEVLNNDTIDNVIYEYTTGFELPTSVKYQNGNQTERDYYKNGKLKEVRFFQKNSIKNILTYSYSADTIKYRDCLYKSNGSLSGKCEETYGGYDSNGNLTYVTSFIQSRNEIIEAKTLITYNEMNHPLKITDSLSNTSNGRAEYHYNKFGNMILWETFSNGKKNRTVYFINIKNR